MNIQDRLRSQYADLERQLSSAHGQEQTLKANVRAAENAARAVREEMQRLRSTLQQVRTQAANDLRNREGEIKRLRSHLEAKQRGGTRAVSVAPPPPGAGAGAVVKPTTTTTDAAPPPPTPASRQLNMSIQAHRRHTLVPLDSPEYHLSQESSEFLAQLCQTLSDENDNLIALMRSSVARLRDIQGLQNAQVVVEGNEAIEQGSGDGAATATTTAEMELPTTCEDLAKEMESALEQLHKILTNPSFVPLEEVQVREEEIARLKLGWQKMEVRWKEAVSMMDGWRRRIADDGTLVNGEDYSVMSPMKNGEDHAYMMSPMKKGVDQTVMSPMRNEDLSTVKEEEDGEVVIDEGLAPAIEYANKDSTRKRQASSQLASPSKSKIAKAAIEHKLSEARAEAEGLQRAHHQDAGVGVDHPTQGQQQEQRKGRIPQRRIARPKKKRDTLSPEELEYLLGVT